ncbi:uncharacterized protein TRAVEDRAFT_41194 [Trametes versicolor FP-101664 SS1]|uniref:uncharacterized protein n=1 Tax=Trametes versicolor (strain FP-101664) TaxID=717944 RepID=UPI0004621CF5|nr:uncharacterized protein TRAVEDRAFT_41194 [Trametes versicolor FP-101664 SS1]EIW63768.1 hypothetical protein TRAVEDRAFT_41194 [Trametes versicolor FP-101664 SS1]
MYAGLVQNLTMFSHIKTSPDYLYVSPDMWRQLLPPHRPVFTNLRNLVFSLSWKYQEEDAIPLHCLLGPNLESLCLHFNCGDLPFEDQLHDAESGASVAAMSVTDLLAHLPQMSPRLRELQLFLGPSTYAHGPLAQTLQGLQSLTEFRIISSTPLSPHGVMVLSSLPCLVTALLDIRAADFPPHSMTERPGDSVNFPALRKLRLLVDTAECAATLLSWSVIDPPGLVELIVRVEVETNITPLQFASITATLPAKRCRITLETIVLHGASKFKCDHPSLVAYPPSAMAPLYSLSALRTVHLLGDCYASLDDDALADMARA